MAFVFASHADADAAVTPSGVSAAMAIAVPDTDTAASEAAGAGDSLGSDAIYLSIGVQHGGMEYRTTGLSGLQPLRFGLAVPLHS